MKLTEPFEILCHDVNILAVAFKFAEPGTPRTKAGTAEFDKIGQIPLWPFDLIADYFLEHLDLLRTQAKAKRC